MNDIHALAHAYVLDALDPDETREFERHLAECDRCTHEVAELREVTGALTRGVAADPPPALRGRVLDAISATPQEPAEARSADVTRLRPSASTAHDASGPATPRRPSRWTVGLVAASLLAAIGLGGWAIQSRQDLDDSRREADTMIAETDQLARLLAAEDVRVVHGSFSDGGAGVVVMSESEGSAMLVGRGLPVLPDDRVYEAWTIRGEEPTAAGTFTPDEESPSMLPLPQETFDATTVAVTIEPAGGSVAPTTDPVFAVDVPAS